MVAGLMLARRRDQGGQPGHEFFGLEEDVGGAVTPGMAQFVTDAAVGCSPQPLAREGRAGGVAADALKAFAVGSRDVDTGMQAHPVGGAQHGAAAFPTDYSGQLLAPLRWRTIRESTARS